MRTSVRVFVTLLVAGALLVAPVPHASAATFNVTLSGEDEVPPVVSSATGSASVIVKRIRGTRRWRVCWNVAFQGLTTTVAHIHSGDRNTAGPPEVTLWTGPKTSPAKGCQRITKTLAKSIIADPVGFYINLHTQDNANGEIRGQLWGTDFAAPAMNGNNERPTPVVTVGTGDATFTVRATQGQVCFTINYSNLSNVTAAHIHEGDEESAGPIVVVLSGTSFPSGHTACVSEFVAGKAAAIAADPRDFYCHIHTTANPNGEIRDQLEDAA